MRDECTEKWIVLFDSSSLNWRNVIGKRRNALIDICSNWFADLLYLLVNGNQGQWKTLLNDSLLFCTRSSCVYHDPEPLRGLVYRSSSRHHSWQLGPTTTLPFLLAPKAASASPDTSVCPGGWEDSHLCASSGGHIFHFSDDYPIFNRRRDRSICKWCVPFAVFMVVDDWSSDGGESNRTL